MPDEVIESNVASALTLPGLGEPGADLLEVVPHGLLGRGLVACNRCRDDPLVPVDQFGRAGAAGADDVLGACVGLPEDSDQVAG